MSALTYRILFLFCIVFYSSFSYSQIDSVSYYLDKDERLCAKEKAVFFAKGVKENEKFKVSYYVMASGKLILESTYADYTLSIKDGPYAKYEEESQKPLKKGIYANNLEEGYWISWDNGNVSDSTLYEKGKDIVRISFSYTDSGMLKSRVLNDSRTKTTEMSLYDDEGHLQRSTKWINGTGDQVYYYTNGSVRLIESYKDKKIVSTRHFKADGTEMTDREYRKTLAKRMEDLREQSEEALPSFPGGSSGFRSFFEKNLRAPSSFHEGVRNAVPIRITFFLDKDGHAYDIVVEESTDIELRHAVEDVFKKMPAWNMKGYKNYGPIRYTISLSRGY